MTIKRQYKMKKLLGRLVDVAGIFMFAVLIGAIPFPELRSWIIWVILAFVAIYVLDSRLRL